jgi:alcohol dehydrogenase class IV
MAQIVILDSTHLAASPRHVIAHSGMDAFVQGVESYLSSKSTWFSDTLALKGLTLLSSSLETVYSDPTSEAADALLFGSCLIGIAFSCSRLGVVHGLAHPLGARYKVPHGLVCAVCLPYVIEFNRDSVKERYGLLGKTLGSDLLDRSKELIERLEIRSPFPQKSLVDRNEIVKETLASGSTAANPRPVTAADVEKLLDRIFRTD